jgi:8-oxo-dGTP pyrophosphatase MutT (NUDIX family)
MQDPQDPEELGMSIVSEHVDRQYAGGRKVVLFDVELLSSRARRRNEPMWSVAPAAGLLVDDERRFVGVVRQGRIGVAGRRLVEAIAGGVDALAAFAREAEQQTGLRPTEVRRVAHLVVSPGRSDEVKTLGIGTGLVAGTRTDGDEIETLWFPISELDRMIEQTGDGGDQTLWGLLLWLWRDIARNHPQLLEPER